MTTTQHLRDKRDKCFFCKSWSPILWHGKSCDPIEGYCWEYEEIMAIGEYCDGFERRDVDPCPNWGKVHNALLAEWQKANSEE